MRALIKSIFLFLKTPIDFVILVFVVPSALVLLLYRRLGSARMKITTSVLKRIGLFPIRNHYYEPLFDERQLTRSLSDNRFLPGFDLNVDGQIALLERFHFTSELVALRLDEKSTEIGHFYVENGGFGPGDGEFLYQFLRAIRPRNVIEIGSGNSSKIGRLALERNRQEKSSATQICIEPYEANWLDNLGKITVVRKRLQECDFDWQNALKPGDLLFIDSSHVIRPQGDVVMEYLEILPQLASGVYVHIHDIFTPKDYPHSWVVDEVRLWNEQYLVEVLLSNQERYEVIGALNYLKHNHYDKIKAVCPYLTETSEPSSLYLLVR